MTKRKILRGLEFPLRGLGFFVLAGALLICAGERQAVAQKYPEHPVKIVIPLGPGGVGDITARILAEKLGDKLGQRFVVENMPGAGGITAMRAIIAAPADGYSLLLATGGIASSIPLYKQFPVDVLNELVPVSSLGYFDCILATNGESEFKTLGDFLKAAKASPGKLNIGTISAGGVQHLTANYFKQAAGIDVVVVPFKTTPDAVIALLRNDVHMVIDFYAALKGNMQSGKLRAVAWAGPTPSPAMPELKTAEAQGVKGFQANSWNSIYVKAGTPPAVIETLNKAMHEILADPAIKAKLLDLGIDSKASTPAAMDAQMRGDIKKWAGVIEKAGIEKR
ncbi:MAG: tripartite tricarboxylate transporter substrate-binding protein [Pseudolabrys sp.]|nr:tripartite tricarboxylate transporter substrate-binding protein [Pseudolabrys sp.]